MAAQSPAQPGRREKERWSESRPYQRHNAWRLHVNLEMNSDGASSVLRGTNDERDGSGADKGEPCGPEHPRCGYPGAGPLLERSHAGLRSA